jgi:hypothetical protein
MLNRRIIKNNTSHATGVIRVGERFAARFDFQGVRYSLGRFDSSDAARDARQLFGELLVIDKAAALKMTDRKPRFDSSTGALGITKTPDGFMVRKNVNGARVYLGHRKTFEEALKLWTTTL